MASAIRPCESMAIDDGQSSSRSLSDPLSRVKSRATSIRQAAHVVARSTDCEDCPVTGASGKPVRTHPGTAPLNLHQFVGVQLGNMIKFTGNLRHDTLRWSPRTYSRPPASLSTQTTASNIRSANHPTFARCKRTSLAIPDDARKQAIDAHREYVAETLDEEISDLKATHSATGLCPETHPPGAQRSQSSLSESARRRPHGLRRVCFIGPAGGG